MDKLEIDFLKEKYHLGRPKKNRLLFLGRVFVMTLVVGATFGAALSYHVSTTDTSTGGTFPKISLLSTLRRFVDGNELKGEENDRVNILLLGIGGEGHEGPQLTDTIIFASYQPSTEKMGLMSLPRDMSVPIPGYGYRKVNHANAFGELDGTGSGPILASSVIGEVLDEEIPYYVRIDFNGFADIIDDMGGIDVYVEKGFTDPTYPTHGKENTECASETVTAPAISETSPSSLTSPTSPTSPSSPSSPSSPASLTSPSSPSSLTSPSSPSSPSSSSIDYSCRFEVLTFQEGWTHLNGDMALKFVRSRHGTNGEGSDFARSARQQKVLLAIKDKVFSASTFLNPSRISRLLETLRANIATNLDVSEILRLAKSVKKMQEGELVHHVIDASDDSPLYATVLNGAYVLLPKNDDWKPLQTIAEYIFTPKTEQKRFATVSEEKPHFAKVEIQNGTAMTGLAFRASQLVDEQGFDVVKVGNAASREYTHTVIYDLTNGQRAQELKELRDFLKADVTLSATGWMVSGDVVPKEISITSNEYQKLATDETIDFLVILGQNSSSLVRN